MLPAPTLFATNIGKLSLIVDSIMVLSLLTLNDWFCGFVNLSSIKSFAFMLTGVVKILPKSITVSTLLLVIFISLEINNMLFFYTLLSQSSHIKINNM